MQPQIYDGGKEFGELTKYIKVLTQRVKAAPIKPAPAKAESHKSKSKHSFYDDDDEDVAPALPSPPKRNARARHVEEDDDEVDDVRYESITEFLHRIFFGSDVEDDDDDIPKRHQGKKGNKNFDTWRLDKGAPPESFTQWLSGLFSGGGDDDEDL